MTDKPKFTEGPWRVGRDLFGASHVYDKGGDRLTNDRMARTEGWVDTCHIIAASHSLRDALNDLVTLCGRSGDANTDFEEIAALFQKETGKMRPGKDAPTPELAATHEEYRQWVSSKIVGAQVALAKADGEQE